MKRLQKITLLIGSLAILTTAVGCMGSFALTKKVYQFNEKVSGNKIVNGIIFIVLLPDAYPFCLLVDTFILNVIESLTGDKLLSMKEGQKEEKMATIKGIDYQFITTKDVLTIKQLSGTEAGKTTSIVYHEKSNQWFMVGKDKTVKVAENGALLPEFALAK